MGTTPFSSRIFRITLIAVLFLPGIAAADSGGIHTTVDVPADNPDATANASERTDWLVLDTLFTTELTPGAVHTRYLVSGPNIMDVVAVDLSAPWLHFETFRPEELTPATVQSRAVDGPGNRVIAAVNGDFFSFETHRPIANQMVRGEFAHGVPARNRYHFAVDTTGRPHMDALSFNGAITLPDGETHPVLGVNRIVADAGILAFNRFAGDRTPSGNGTLEFVLQPAGSTDQTGSGIEQTLQVQEIHHGGSTPIPQDGYVIRVQGAENTAGLAGAIAKGDLVTFRPGFEPDRRGLTDVMGGGVLILDRGQPYSGTNEARHPRTFVAMDRDTTTVYLCTVDGRQLTSIGMSYREMADALLQIGAWHAVNLDGGGSTTLVIRNEVANSPSDPGGERSVANALLLVSTAPEGEPVQLEVTPETFELFPHESQLIAISAFDAARNPVPPPDELTWEFDPALGTLADGVFSPGSTDTTGTLTVHSDGISARAEIRIHHYTTLTPDPEKLRLAPGERTSLTLHGRTADGTTREIPLDRVRFDQPDDALYLSDDGTVFATGHGSGALHLDIGSASASIPFSVSGDAVVDVIHDFTGGISGWATPAQTHRAQILGVDPERSTLSMADGTGVWTFVDDPERNLDWDIRITRHLRQELGSQLYGSYIGALAKAADDLEIRFVIRDGDGQLETGPPVRLTPGQWQLVQVRLSDDHFEGYLNGDGSLTREGNQINGFRITASGKEQGAAVTLKIDSIMASPFPLDGVRARE